MFFLMPGIFVGLTLIDSRSIAMYIFMGIITLITVFVLSVNYIKSNEKLARFLPHKLLNWHFLPEFMRSLDPYDRLLTGCCTSCGDPEKEGYDDQELKTGNGK